MEILPAPAGEGDGAWWQTLEAPRLAVVARLPFLADAAHADAALIASVDFAELCIVSDVVFDIDPALEAGAIVNVEKIDAEKCARCWRHLPDVNEETGLCGRCDAVVAV